MSQVRGHAASASDTYLLFNRKLIDMLEDLSACFPTVTEFSMALSPPGRMLMSMDPCHSQRMFQEYVILPYEQRILDRDEAFLLTQEQFGPTTINQGDLVALVKRVWCDASTKDRDAIWRHLHVLIVLSRRCEAI